MKIHPWFRTALLAFAAAFLTTASSCDDDDDIDHKPPPGQGSIVIDNNTSDDISVFFDGIEQEETKDGKRKAYDLDPGLYRVALLQQGGDQSFREDVDVLQGELTVLDVAFGFGDEYDVFIYFDD